MTKPTGVYWIPSIPDSWQMRRAWQLFSQRKSLGDENAPALVPSRHFGVVTQDDYTVLANRKPTDNERTKHLMIEVRPGDFIISMGSYESGIEHSAISGKVSNHYKVLIPAPDLNPGYYRWLFKSQPLIDGIAGLAVEIRVGQEIHYSKFARLSLPLPPLEVQQRIADYLDRETAEIDAAVADLDRYGALLEKRKKNQINLAFAPIIEAKEVTPLGVFYSISNGDRGENYPKADEITDQGIPFLNAGDIRKGSVSLNAAKFVTREKYNAMGGAKLRAGDILFCLRGSLGKHGVVDFDEGSVASSLCVIRPLDSSAHSSHFLNYFMETTFFAEQILFAENGSAQPNLSGESLARFRIPSSTISEQKRIIRELDRGTAEIDALIEESKKLRDLLLKRRSVLITEVVTGRKQV